MKLIPINRAVAKHLNNLSAKSWELGVNCMCVGGGGLNFPTVPTSSTLNDL
jgi:hypothetical protein